MIKGWPLPACFLALFFPLVLQAQVTHVPEHLYLSADSPELQLRLTGLPEDADVRCTVDGVHADGRASGAGSCADWCTVRPGNLRASSGGSATVTLRVQQPADVAEGEYHALLTVAPAGTDTAGPLLRVPVHFRVGDVYSDIKLDDVGVERTTEEVRILLHFRAAGNAAYRGNMQLRISDGSGRTVFETAAHLDVYGKETLVYVLSADNMARGKYRVSMRFDSEREDLGPHAIPVMPKKFAVEISIS